MKKFNVVSLDMFGTLADLSSVKYLVWQQFLQDKYTKDLADEHWNLATDYLFEYYENQVVKERQYIPPKVMYEVCYSRLFSEIGLNYDPKEAARILAQHHAYSELFEDALLFLVSVGKEYPICLSSDTDEDMLDQLRYIYPFDKVFTSEEIGSYKTSVDGRFFSSVVEYYGVEPESIIHIGDTISDIIGAGEAGIVTCWLNRKGKKWSHDVKPDYKVTSLIEAALILGVEISPE
jgi:FMN phosphatase YigB (HAD superfamily)